MVLRPSGPTATSGQADVAEHSRADQPPKTTPVRGAVRRERAEVLVVGGGIAGAMAAIAAREQGLDVLLLDRGFFGRTGCSALASGMFSYYRPDDDWQYWLSNHGGTMVNERLLKKAISFQYELVHMLESWGIEWVREGGDGDPIARMGGPGIPFPHSAMMSGGGPRFMMAVRAHARRIGVRVLDRVFAAELLTSDGRLPTSGRVVGAFGIDTRAGSYVVVEANVTVMATGPMHFPYPKPAAPFTGMPVELSGDGIAMALRAGAELGKMEIGGDGLVQAMFHCAQGFEMLLGLGGRLVNAEGDDFLLRYAETIEHRVGSRRSSLGNAATRELEAGRGPILRDNRGLDPAATRLLDLVIPIVMRTLRSAGVEVGSHLGAYTRAIVGSTAVSGAGIGVGPDGRTSLPGLLAAGNSTDGAYVVMGQNLATCGVLGYWAGLAATEAVQAWDHPTSSPAQVRAFAESVESLYGDDSQQSVKDVHTRVEEILTGVGYVMTAEKLRRALDGLAELREIGWRTVRSRSPRDTVRLLGLRNFCEVLAVSYQVMEHRTESRGNVLRSDHPYTDNVEWLCMTRARLSGEGEIEIWDRPMPEGTDYRRVARERVGHPFFVEPLPGDEPGQPVASSSGLGEVRNLVAIDEAICTRCGICVQSCPTDVFSQEHPGQLPEIRHPDDCQGCFLCEIDCPYHAVKVTIVLDERARLAIEGLQTPLRLASPATEASAEGGRRLTSDRAPAQPHVVVPRPNADGPSA